LLDGNRSSVIAVFWSRVQQLRLSIGGRKAMVNGILLVDPAELMETIKATNSPGAIAESW